MSSRKVKIGLLGCGTVGRGFVELLARNHALIRQRSGAELTISKILVRDLGKSRPGVDRELLTPQPEKVLNNGCDLIVELIGGIEPARSFIEQALACGKHVVTANKALLALDGFRLRQAAETQNLRLGFEASVCSGIPIIRALRSGLVGNHIESLSGILNGTCNYILTRMSETGLDFDGALHEAQQKGFAEADPTLDVDGHDAAQKLKILAELAFQAEIASAAVAVEGIRGVTADDVQAARELGYVIKHVAIAEIVKESVSLQVAPVLLPKTHALASVHDENNAVLVRGDAVGEMFFAGKGAGSLPSASGVLSDVVDIACHQGGMPVQFAHQVHATVSDSACQRYVRFTVGDPTAIGPITQALERNHVAVSRAAAVWAKHAQGTHQVRILTQPARRQAIEDALQHVGHLGLSHGKPLLLRVAA